MSETETSPPPPVPPPPPLSAPADDLVPDAHGFVVLAPIDREAVRAIVERLGIARAAGHFRVCRESLSKAIAGLPLRLGTAVLLRAGIAPRGGARG